MDTRDFYIYAYIDPLTAEPFYIGKGHGDRAVRHIRRPSYHETRDTFFYRKLRKMMREGLRPDILIIKDALTEEAAYEIESMLIHLVGMKANGTGPLCNLYVGRRGANSGFTLQQGIQQGKAVEVWGKMFPSLSVVARDPRCTVGEHTMRNRMQLGLSIEDAATRKGAVRPPRPPKPPKPNLPRKPMKGKKVTCWGEEFISRAALCRDPRCIVSSSQLNARLAQGWDIERAATTPIDLVAARKLDKPLTM